MFVMFIHVDIAKVFIMKFDEYHFCQVGWSPPTRVFVVDIWM